jgi:hypothetical protein
MVFVLFFFIWLPIRSFILSRPSRRKLKQSGILKERVFGCDLGEHLLNSGRESKSLMFFFNRLFLISKMSLFHRDHFCACVTQIFFSPDGVEVLRRVHRGVRHRRRHLSIIGNHLQHSKAQVTCRQLFRYHFQINLDSFKYPAIYPFGEGRTCRWIVCGDERKKEGPIKKKKKKPVFFFSTC